MVPIQIGNYTNQILCDVISMDIGHVILGRPCQFDNNTIHDGFSNKITFSQNNHKYTLFPLSPAEVRAYTIILKKKIEQENMFQ